MDQEFDKVEAYAYEKILPDGSKQNASLIIRSRVVAFTDDSEVNNPTGDESAYFYGISIDGVREQLTTFQPWEEGFKPMTKEEAKKFLQDDIDQTLLNYWIQ